jgi:CheY-like chemotaxis protein
VKRILVVDDETSIADAISDVLSMEGYSVELASNGQVGLEMAQRSPPSAMLVDVMMPIMDGLTLVKELRNDDDLRSIPVVMMSAGAIPAEKQSDDIPFLRKPFQIDELLSAIETVTARAA